MASKLLIIGYGNIAKRHLKILNKLYPTSHIGLLRHKKYYSQNIIGVNEIFYDLKKALKFEPDLVVFCNPASKRINLLENFLNMGADLFIEKPLLDNFLDSKKIFKKSLKSKSKIFIGYNLRYFESLIKFKKLIEKNSCGKIISFRSEVGSYLPEWRDKKNYENNVSANKNLGGGVLLELSHEINYLNWLFGDVKWVKASISKQSSLKLDVEDTANIILSFKKNQSKSELIGNLNMDFYRRDSTRNCIVIGEKNSLKWDGLKGTVEKYDAKKDSWKTIFKKKNELNISYLKEWEYFKFLNKNSAKKINSIEESLKVLKVIEACKTSSKKEKKVYLK